MKKCFMMLSIAFIFAWAVMPSANCYAAGEGYIDVSVSAPDSFKHSIMINLVDNDGANYVLTAEEVNQWKCNSALPAGDYIVDYVSMDVADKNFNLGYPKAITIVEGIGAAFDITVNSNTNDVQLKDNSKEQEMVPEPEVQPTTFIQRLLVLLKNILVDNIVTLSVMMGLIIYLIIRWRRRKEDDKNY